MNPTTNYMIMGSRPAPLKLKVQCETVERWMEFTIRGKLAARCPRNSHLFFRAIRADQRIKRPADKWPVLWSVTRTPNGAQEHSHAAARSAATAKFSLNRKSRRIHRDSGPVFGPFPHKASLTFLVDCVGPPTHYLPRIAYLNCESKWASP